MNEVARGLDDGQVGKGMEAPEDRQLFLPVSFTYDSLTYMSGRRQYNEYNE